MLDLEEIGGAAKKERVNLKVSKSRGEK